MKTDNRGFFFCEPSFSFKNLSKASQNFQRLNQIEMATIFTDPLIILVQSAGLMNYLLECIE